MKLIWVIICSKSSIDVDTNNISLIDVLEEISVSSEIIQNTIKGKKKTGVIIPLAFELVSLWEKNTDDPIDAEIRMDLVDPKGGIIKTDVHPLTMKTKINRLRHRMFNQGLPIQKPGKYVFKIQMRMNKKGTFKTAGETSLEVKFS